MIRKALFATVLLGFVAACGGDSTGPDPEGTLAVQFDAASCNPGNAEVFIDGTSQGAYFWTPGVSRTWTVDAGSHSVGAREVGGTLFIWPAQTVNVPESGTFTATFTC